MFKNMEQRTVLALKDQITCLPGQINSKTLTQTPACNVTLFAFDKGEEISTHESHGDAMVLILEGVGQVTIDATVHTLHAGDSIIMPARHPHAVSAPEPFKMLLTVVFPPEAGKNA